MRVWMTLYQHQEKALPFEWLDSTGAIINYSTGYTFVFSLVSAGVDRLNKTTNIQGFATSPNVIVSIAAGELAAVPPGLYKALLTARKTSETADDIFEAFDPPIVEILATPTV